MVLVKNIHFIKMNMEMNMEIKCMQQEYQVGLVFVVRVVEDEKQKGKRKLAKKDDLYNISYITISNSTIFLFSLIFFNSLKNYLERNLPLSL